jgi:hypothetical protein|tara:strand:+ start:1063 stop:1461 length:399 start_codon:yes stop_codon:yes gene_type:complete
MYTLADIFDQAMGDPASVKMSDKNKKSALSNGSKINKLDDCIEILDVTGVGYYKEFTDDQYRVMLENGWRDGCYMMSIERCKAKLELIENSIRDEVNSRRNDKHIQHLKSRRENILKRFTKIKSKLNGKEHI